MILLLRYVASEGLHLSLWIFMRYTLRSGIEKHRWDEA
jgi:hypothetical protein